MRERFKQKQIHFSEESDKGAVSISKLMELIEDYPYLEIIEKELKIKSIKDDIVAVENIGRVYKELKYLKSEYKLFTLKADNKHVSFVRGKKKVEGIRDDNPVIFNISEYIDDDAEIAHNFKGYALYDSKSQYFESFSMSKYANMLFDKKLDELAEINLDYFRGIPPKEGFNKTRSYRIVENKGESFVRGITSLGYKEYGVHFAFVVSMIMLHRYMKRDIGNSYKITYAAVNESKLELIATSGELKDAGDFGKIRSAISIKTNDFGKGAFSLSHIIKVVVQGGGFYLYPKNTTVQRKDIAIYHNTGAKKALEELVKMADFYEYADIFIKDLESVKSIKKPEELRKRIRDKFENHRSLLHSLKGSLRPIFRKALSNDIKDFALLLEMCGKAEELEIDYDLKEKLRIEISDIIMNK